MADITLLDGGVGQEIVARAGASDTLAWATEAMRRAPGTAEAVHRDFLSAGATVAMANTYAVLPDRLPEDGRTEALRTLRAQAMAEARAARDVHGSGRIAATIGPLGASYRPDLMPPHDKAVAVYDDAVAALGPESDLLVFETVASVAHARAALAALDRSGRPGWIAVTVDDEDGSRLRSGERVAEAAALIRDSSAGAALANCSAPEAMPAALDALAKTGLPYGAYANAFETITKDFLARPAVDNLSRRRDMAPAPYAAHALDWVARGATVVGGCCETTPAHIAAVAERLRAAGHGIV
ncbi:homocysteine S-methyltransferase family protein [Roseivivax sediminis]|uniref:Homocysteine S-methyltransferase n=1 Tax=Roseivivax sediminis TaxID=936889 RepID=A0A1I1W4R2_9RHOB|nr:homocysteine S-methyltransferase family protein [Roseivivax sediminis]SFD90132.1 homocysteine S-methyltransferase [Roseivivax sediminis]